MIGSGSDPDTVDFQTSLDADPERDRALAGCLDSRQTWIVGSSLVSRNTHQGHELLNSQLLNSQTPEVHGEEPVAFAPAHGP
jgi:hypothetical protein